MADDDHFLSRWSRRKVQARVQPVPDEPAPTPKSSITPTLATVPTVPAAAALVDSPHGLRAVAESSSPDESSSTAAPSAPAAPPPTLDDVRQLTTDADFSRFVATDVSPDVRNAAMRKLFSDPSFNVMDGLDIYIDDYSKPDPLPTSLARQLVSAQFMKLFDEPKEAPLAESSTPPEDADAPRAIPPSPSTDAP